MSPEAVRRGLTLTVQCVILTSKYNADFVYVAWGCVSPTEETSHSGWHAETMTITVSHRL